jgi:hypothetical protein
VPSTIAPNGTYTREPFRAEAGTIVSFATRPHFKRRLSLPAIATSTSNMPLARSAALAISVTVPLSVASGSAS